MRKIFSFIAAVCFAITMNAQEATPAIPVFDVADAISNYGVTYQKDDSIVVRGVVTRIQIKGKNFAKYGSAEIFVKDIDNDKSGEWEYFNCFSLEEDTFRVTFPVYDPAGTDYTQLAFVTDGNGVSVWLGDTVEAVGKALLWQNKSKTESKYELDQGCYLTSIKEGPRSGLIPEDPNKPKNLGEKTISEFIEMKNTKDTCILTGVVAQIDNAVYGNLYLADETDTLLVWGVLTPEGEKKKFSTLNVDIDDTLTIKAVYYDYQGTPEAKDAIFVSVKKENYEPQTINITMVTGTDMLMFDDYTYEEGWWQIQAQNELYYITLSNAGVIDDVPGTYTAAQLDQKYSFVEVIATNREYSFVDGSITVEVSEEGVVTVKGSLISSKGDTYVIDLTYTDPVQENEVEIVCTGIMEDYRDTEMPGVWISAESEEGIGVSLFLWAEDAVVGEYTTVDLYYDYSYIVLGEDDYTDIFDAEIEIVENGDNYLVYANLLCYNNTLYKFIIGIYPEALENTAAKTKAVKTIKNGQLIIEKNGVRYTATGAKL